MPPTIWRGRGGAGPWLGFAVSARVDDSGRLSTVRMTVGHLIALKILARDDVTRPQDLADLRALLAAASTDDLRLATDSVALIESRGFNRGRDLIHALAKLESEIEH